MIVDFYSNRVCVKRNSSNLQLPVKNFPRNTTTTVIHHTLNNTVRSSVFPGGRIKYIPLINISKSKEEIRAIH